MSQIFYTLPTSLKIGVMRGGEDPEYDLSLKTGAHVLNTLSSTHNPLDILISKDGTWHIGGVERPAARILKNVDVVFNSLHGNFGEDGRVQELLNNYGVKFTGSDKYSSAIAMNKHLAKEHLIPFNIKTPVHMVVKSGENVLKKAKEIWNNMIYPFAVKPSKGGSSFGFVVVHDFDGLFQALEYLTAKDQSVLVEEFIPGISVSCLVTENFRDEDLYAFPPSNRLKRKETEMVEDVAKQVHKILNLRGYSQSDFIVSPKRGVYFLEVNTLPKLTEKSLATKSLDAVGVTTLGFLHHIIGLAL